MTSILNENMLSPVQDANTNPMLIFRNGQCVFRMATLSGPVIERLVSWEAVREAATNIPIDSGWLAPEIVRCGTGGKGDWAVAFIPPGRHSLELTSGTPGESETADKVTAPLPGMVMFGIANKYFVWAVKTETLNPHMEVYRCPLPNVMQDAGVCWGLLKPPTASARSILSAWKLFIGSTFNNHAANGKSKRKRDDVRELIKELATAGDEARYPVDDLIRQVEHTGLTLDHAVRAFMEVGEMPG